MRLDARMVLEKLAATRSRAEDAIRSGYVTVNGRVITKSGFDTKPTDIIKADVHNYVSRAALKLEGANKKFKVSFDGKVVLDVGSSTGGFTQYALRHGAATVIAVDVGTDQMDPRVSSDPRVELHEKTDIRNFGTTHKIDLVVADVSFVSLRQIVPSILKLVTSETVLMFMCKPQFEAGKEQVNKGVIKNEAVRRKVLADFEAWLKTKCVVLDKVDSSTAGEKGNVERFFLAKKHIT